MVLYSRLWHVYLSSINLWYSDVPLISWQIFIVQWLHNTNYSCHIKLYNSYKVQWLSPSSNSMSDLIFLKANTEAIDPNSCHKIRQLDWCSVLEEDTNQNLLSFISHQQYSQWNMHIVLLCLLCFGYIIVHSGFIPSIHPYYSELLQWFWSNMWVKAVHISWKYDFEIFSNKSRWF